MTYITPRIHSNGTSRDELIEQACDARNAILDAISAVQRAAPNARDYYPQPEAFKSATIQHNAWVARLENIAHELAQYAEAIAA